MPSGQPDQALGRDVRHGSDRWLYTAPLLALLHLILILTLHARPGLPGVILWQMGPIVLTFVAVLALAHGLVQSIRARLTWTGRRAAGCAGLMLISVIPLTYRTYPSSRDGRPSEIRFRLPLDGPVTVLWGGPTRDVNYHVFAPPERWGYDMVVTRHGRSFRGAGTALTDYHAFGLPVLAPAAGTVRRVSDGAADRPIGARGVWTNPCGNHVVIEVAPGEFLFLCHLHAGSIAVAADERVAAGDQVGRVGNSGRSTQPHLHVHLQTTPDAQFGEGIPLLFHGYVSKGRLVQRGMPTGGRNPDVVEHAGSVSLASSRCPRGRLSAASRSAGAGSVLECKLLATES